MTLRLTLILLLTLAVPARAGELCLVVGVSDGDTLSARCGAVGAFRLTKIRLAEVDAPEKAQPFGQRARLSLSALCFGAWATIHPEKEDRYGRMVAHVECRGQDANTEQVRRGMAWVYRQYAPASSPLFALESEARTARVGLWTDQDPVAPWEWRRQH